MNNTNKNDEIETLFNATDSNQPQTETLNISEFSPSHTQINNQNLLNNQNNIQLSNDNSIETIGFTQPTINNTIPLENDIIYQPQQTFNQQPINFNTTDEKDLLKAFIGKNYEKITNRLFNFSGFFFTSFYFFYRKMFLFGIILFILNFITLNFINNFITTFLFNIATGFCVNKIYVYYANKKITKLKQKYTNKNINELNTICAKSGGTSFSSLYLGSLSITIITIVISIIMIFLGISSSLIEFFTPDNWNINLIDDFNKVTNMNSSDLTSNKKLEDDVILTGHLCVDDNCIFYVEKDNNETEYSFNANNMEFFSILNNYTDYIKINIYYKENKKEKIIVDYKIFLKSTNEEISYIKTEDELRKTLNLYTAGIYTKSLTLIKKSTPGAGFKDGASFSYITCTFEDENNNQYEMEYILNNNVKTLFEGNKYTITFEVVKGDFNYEFYIKNFN